jgi:hypothetical protein
MVWAVQGGHVFSITEGFEAQSELLLGKTVEEVSTL